MCEHAPVNRIISNANLTVRASLAMAYPFGPKAAPKSYTRVASRGVQGREYQEGRRWAVRGGYEESRIRTHQRARPQDP